MKECPNCHKKYDDSMNFCTDCGVALKDISNQFSTLHNNQVNIKAAEMYKGNTNKSGCLKKILIGGVLLVVVFFVLAHYVSNAATYLRVEPNQLVASKGGGKIKVDIDYDGYIWTINHTPDWVEINEDENSFDLSVGKNLSGSRREGTITVQSGKQLAQVTITQYGIATYIRGSKSNLKFGKAGGTQTVSLDTDGCDLNVECADFIQTSFSDNGDLIVRVKNNSDEYRTSQIKVYEDNQSWYINVEQGGKCNSCHGSGKMTCSWCSGAGTIGYGMFTSICMSCGGSGSYKCGNCNGTGEKE